MSAGLLLDRADASQGCPRGLEPVPAGPVPGAGRAIDPAPFVRRRGDMCELELAVFGAKCAGCIAKIEKAMLSLEDMARARLNLSTGRLSLAWRDGAPWPPLRVAATLEDLGFRTAPFDPSTPQNDHDAEGRMLLRALGVAGFAAANIMLLSVSVWAGGAEMGAGTRGMMHLASALIAIPAALYAGRPFFSSAWRALRSRRANMDVPISLGVVLALCLSTYEFFVGGEHAYFDAAVMLLFFLLIGRYLDHRLRWRARAAARELLAMQAVVARRFRNDGSLEAVAAREILIGDQLLLSPGDRAPVDGIVTEGASYANASLVTGESAPQKLTVGDAIHAGVVNGSDRLVMRAGAKVEDSLVADLTRLIEAGEQCRSRYVRLADRAAGLYVPVVHSLALATLLGWLLVGGGPHAAVTNAVAVLIITCPCALGLAAPAVQIVATGRLFKRGVLVKSGDALERLAEADLVVFDKTGTLTLGRPLISNREVLTADVIEQAASLARVSRHPLSRAIAEAAGPGRVANDAKEFPGLGIEASIAGVTARLGRADWIGARQTNDSSLETWFRLGDDAPVRIRFADVPHKDAAAVVKSLAASGLSVELLSGDRPPAVEAVAKMLGLKSWRAAVSPKDKAARLAELRDDGVKAAMVGDGLNDAPSLALAHVSLSPGSAADVSQAAADFVYLRPGLAPVLEAVEVSRKARRRVLENFAFAAAYNAFAVPLAVFGLVTPLIAALAMSGSSLIVTLNALRLAAGRQSDEAAV